MEDRAQDERYLDMIACFRPRIKAGLRTGPVLDHLPELGAERDRIRAAAEQLGEPAAAELLLRAVERGPHTPGWFAAFVTALQLGGCALAASYANPSLRDLPSAAEEAEHDLCVALLQVLYGSLVDRLRTRPVVDSCLRAGLATEDDRERPDQFQEPYMVLLPADILHPHLGLQMFPHELAGTSPDPVPPWP